MRTSSQHERTAATVLADRRATSSSGLVACGGAALAMVALLVAASGALAAVHLSAGAFYTARSSACHRATVPGTRCVFTFRASSNGWGMRFAGKTVISSWTCRRGPSEALLGGTAVGAYPVPGLVLQPDGKLSGSAGRGPRKVTVTGHIAEAGTKVVLTFHLVRRRCVTPQLTLIEGVIPPRPAH